MSAPHCEHEPRRSRFIAKPVGTFSIAGAQPKVVATDRRLRRVLGDDLGG